LVKYQDIVEGYSLKCPRCGQILYLQKSNTINETLAYTLTALMCFYPAVTASMMTLDMGDLSHQQSLFSGVLVLLSEGYYLVAILTFMSSLFVPLLRLILLAYVTGCLFIHAHYHYSIQRLHKSLLWSFRLYHHIEEWGMLDVYMLGIIVSIVKLLSMAEIHPGFGLWTYAILLITSIQATNSLNHHEVWAILLQNKMLNTDPHSQCHQDNI
jgi:paraquat-inducible protein A